MAELGVMPAVPGAAFLGAGATGRVFCVRPAAGGRAAAAAAAAPQQLLALKVSSRVPRGELALEFGALAAAAACGAPVAAPVPGSHVNIFKPDSGQYLGGGYLLAEVMEPAPPITSLQRCRKAFGALAALHAKGFPHGDARLPNLLQRGSGGLAWVDLGAPKPGAPAYAADREVLVASVLGAALQWRAQVQVAAALEAAAQALGAAATNYDALAAAVYEALRQR